MLGAIDVHNFVIGCGIGRVMGVGDLNLAPLAVGGYLHKVVSEAKDWSP